MMKTLDRSSVKLIADDIIVALEAVAAKHGVKFNYKGGSFTPNNCVYKIEAAVISDGGEVCNRERDDFKRSAFIFGLSPEMLDKTFVMRGETFQITGLSPRKHKFPVLAKNLANGKSFKFPALTIKNLMATVAA